MQVIFDRMFYGRIYVLIIAFVLDMLFGDPHFLPLHPVVLIGRFTGFLTKVFLERNIKSGQRSRKRERTAGIFLVIFVLLISVSIIALILYGAYRINVYLGIAVEGILCYRLISMKDLRDESMEVYRALIETDSEEDEALEPARKALSMIVGRDTKKLSREGIIRAAVETVSENTSDGVIAPIIYMALFGGVGAIFYKAVNTMDSMVGYKNEKYIFFGTAAAGLDDAANFIPSRLSALLMIAASFILKLDAKNAIKVFLRDRFKHSSPNSAQTESVCAGALNIRLGGGNYYFGEYVEKPYIGDDTRNVETTDIIKANRLLYVTGILGMLLCVGILAGIGFGVM